MQSKTLQTVGSACSLMLYSSVGYGKPNRKHDVLLLPRIIVTAIF